MVSGPLLVTGESREALGSVKRLNLPFQVLVGGLALLKKEINKNRAQGFLRHFLGKNLEYKFQSIEIIARS